LTKILNILIPHLRKISPPNSKEEYGNHSQNEIIINSQNEGNNSSSYENSNNKSSSNFYVALAFRRLKVKRFSFAFKIFKYLGSFFVIIISFLAHSSYFIEISFFENLLISILEFY
jgi:hypothetical protein